MRAFVAVDAPPPPTPWPAGFHPEDHLTLHFFGDLPPERAPVVVEALQGAAADATAFDVELRGVGAFPDARRPRVVWAGVGQGAEAIHSLAGRLREALAVRGFPAEDRAFVPHLTLARIRSPASVVWARRLLAAPEMADRVWARFPVSELLLKESLLLPGGAQHSTLARVGLGHRDRPAAVGGTASADLGGTPGHQRTG